MNIPLVSVCIPTYNGARFIKEALCSVEKQTYHKIEIIISDDDSQDETLDIVYAACLPNTRILTHSRYGLVDNWNYCIKNATGRYVKFLFQDDILKPDCIAKMVAAAEQDDEVGLVFSCRDLILSQRLPYAEGLKNLHKGWHQLLPLQSGLELLKDKKLLKHPYNKIGEPTNTLIRRSVFEHIGFFDPAFSQLPDLEMWLRIMTYYKVSFIDEELASFRIHEGQTTQINSIQKRAWLEIYELWLKILKNPIFSCSPSFTRRRILNNIIMNLLRESIKAILMGKYNRLAEVVYIIKQITVECK